MEGGDNVGGANNDVGEGASSGAAVPAGGGGIVDSSSLVVEVGNGFTAIYNIIDAGSLREWHNGHAVKVVQPAAGK